MEELYCGACNAHGKLDNSFENFAWSDSWSFEIDLYCRVCDAHERLDNLFRKPFVKRLFYSLFNRTQYGVCVSHGKLDNFFRKSFELSFACIRVYATLRYKSFHPNL